MYKVSLISLLFILPMCAVDKVEFASTIAHGKFNQAKNLVMNQNHLSDDERSELYDIMDADPKFRSYAQNSGSYRDATIAGLMSLPLTYLCYEALNPKEKVHENPVVHDKDKQKENDSLYKFIYNIKSMLYQGEQGLRFIGKSALLASIVASSYCGINFLYYRYKCDQITSLQMEMDSR